MPYRTTLVYTEPLLRRAVLMFWRRSVGFGMVSGLIVVSVILAVLIVQGDTSWEVGVLATVLVLAAGLVVAVYFIHYRNTLRKFREMGAPQAQFIADDATFTFNADIGSSTMQWSVVKELWRFQDVWLLLYSPAQFSTLPVVCLPPDMQDYVLQRVRAAGGKIR